MSNKIVDVFSQDKNTALPPLSDLAKSIGVKFRVVDKQTIGDLAGGKGPIVYTLTVTARLNTNLQLDLLQTVKKLAVAENRTVVIVAFTPGKRVGMGQVVESTADKLVCLGYVVRGDWLHNENAESYQRLCDLLGISPLL